MTSDVSSQVIVVGAGLAGVALGRRLFQSNIPCVVLERRDVFSNDGFAVNLPGNAIIALSQMGLRDAISRMGRPTRRREYRDHRDRLVFEIDEDAFWGLDHRPRCVKRSDLLAALRQGLPADLFRMSCVVTDIRQTDATVIATLEDGQAIAGGLLVGADGIHSRTRACAFPEARTQSAVLSRASWRFIAPDPGVDGWTVWAGPRSLFLLIPVGDGEVYGWASVSGGASARDAADAPRLGVEISAAFEHFPKRVTDTLDYLVSNPGSVHWSPLEEVRLDAWANDRVVLIGDAAHATAPVWAQGVALALEDANALGDLLDTDADWGASASRFETARRQRVRHVQSMTDKMSKAARLPTFVRNLLMPVVGPKRYHETYGPLRA